MKKPLKSELDLERLTTFVKKAMQDPDTRQAIGNAYTGGRDVFEKYFRDDRRSGMSRLARDQKAQDDLGDMVRSITKALDSGLAANKRRGRKLLVAVAGLVGLGAFVMRRRKMAVVPDPAPAAQNPMTQAAGAEQESVNGTQEPATRV